MTATAGVRRRWVLAGFAIVALLLAAVAPYAASSDPDGLESVTQQGCTETADGWTGACPARDAQAHAFADLPLADYTVGGDSGLGGVAGVVGALVTLAVTTGLFLLLARGRRARGGHSHDPGNP